MTLISTREDLDAIQGTPAHGQFMTMLAGTIFRTEKGDGGWSIVEDATTIERFGFTRADFPDAAPPVLPEYTTPAQPTQLEKDQLRYQRRAAAKDGLIAWMAADNMSRVRAGVWTVADLQVLLVDLAPVNAMMQTLSFELAAQAIAASTNPLLTPEIKAAWVAKLTEHFYT